MAIVGASVKGLSCWELRVWGRAKQRAGGFRKVRSAVWDQHRVGGVAC